MAADRLTGKAGYITYSSVTLSITKWSANVDRKLADTTDSGDYQTTPDMIGPTQLPVSAKVNVDVEGRYRKSQTPSALIANLFTGVSAVPATLGLDANTVLGHGAFDISNFVCDLPVEDTVTFKCTMMSNGLFTPNS